MRLRVWSKAAVVAVACTLLAGCLLLPGRFSSELSLNRDGTFAFRYKGEIFVLALSKMMADQAKDKPFKLLPKCTDSGEAGTTCSDEDEAAQRKAWQEERDAARAKARKDAETAKAMLGGIDPADPKASERFAAQLARQAGWRSVVPKGDGRFEVDYAIAGRLDHDFTFPTVEKMPMLVPFVTVIRRADGSVRMDAPAYSAGQSAGPLAGFAGMASAMGGDRNTSVDKAAGPPGFPTLDGQFSVRTNGTILANNTDEGPKPDPTGQRLDWAVNPQTTSAPTALIKF